MPKASVSNFIIQLLVFKMPKTGVKIDKIGVLNAKISGVLNNKKVAF